MPSIARKNLLLDIPRFLVAQAGIMFAVSLVTIQTGLQGGFSRSSSELIDKSNADIWITSEKQVHLGLTVPIRYEKVNFAKKITGVEKAEGLIINGSLWRDPKSNIASITYIGFEPDSNLFSPWNITKGQLKDLKKPYTVFVDENNLTELNIKKIKDPGILGILPAEVVGFTKGTNSLIFGGLIFTSLDNANAYSNSPLAPQIPCHLAAFRSPCKEIDEDTPKLKKIGNVDYVTFILIKAKQGEDLTLLKQRLEQKLTGIRAYSKEEMAKLTQNYWTERSGIGFVLGIGAVVGIVVGIVIVGQILYSSVSDHIKEFGTLKAMGASDWVIYGIIIEQSLWMAVLGYLPGMALCYGVAKWTAATQAITILITPYSAVIVFGVTVIMCVSSAVFAIQKVTKLDPAIVFKT